MSEEADAWIEREAAKVAAVLGRPEVRAELAALLGAEDARRRARRLERARAELEGIELRVRLTDEGQGNQGGEDGPS